MYASIFDRKLPENRIAVLVLPMIMIVVKIGTFGGADIICLFPVNVIDRRKICPLVFARKAIFAKSHPITSEKIFVSNLGIEPEVAFSRDINKSRSPGFLGFFTLDCLGIRDFRDF